MEHFFSLPVRYNGEELSFNGRLVTFAYTYKFYIVVDNKEFVFERDDELNFRVLDESDNSHTTNADLLNAIISSLQKIL